MAFIPFFSRPEPDTVYIDHIVVSVQIGNIDFYVTPRGIGAEKAEKVVLEDKDSDEASEKKR